jgi:glycosyltransferase involved in cell wall biosynthesis
MVKILTDDKLRDDLITKGLERAKDFTWDKTAEQTKEIYFKLM